MNNMISNNSKVRFIAIVCIFIMLFTAIDLYAEQVSDVDGKTQLEQQQEIFQKNEKARSEMKKIDYIAEALVARPMEAVKNNTERMFLEKVEVLHENNSDLMNPESGIHGRKTGGPKIQFSF